jgi:hypothetical protein
MSLKPGELTGQGTLFMRGSIYEQRTSSGELQLVFPLLERRGSGVQQLTAIWKGADAEIFYRQHGSAIKAGKALAFTFSRLFCHSNELHAIVYTCCLAPDRWQAERDAHQPNPTTQTQPAEPITQ